MLHLKKFTLLCGRCLSEFIDWRYSQSCWYFRPTFVNCWPSNLLSGQLLPPSPLPCVNNTGAQVLKKLSLSGLATLSRLTKFWFDLPCVNKYTAYTYTLCKGLGGWSLGSQKGRRPQTDKTPAAMSSTGQFFRYRHLALHSISLIFLRQEGRGPKTDKHLPQSPFTGKIFQMTIFSFGNAYIIFLLISVVQGSLV